MLQQDLSDIISRNCHIIIKSQFISESYTLSAMIEEAITIAAVIGGSAAAVWYAKNKFQPEIERNLARIEKPASEVQELSPKKKDHK